MFWSKDRGGQTKRIVPYNPQTHASEEAFVGRDSLIAQLTESCKEGHSYGLIGGSGIGKTSLLYAVKRNLLKSSPIGTTRILIPVYLEFHKEHLGSAPSILQAILSGLVQSIETQTGLVYPLPAREKLELQAQQRRFEQPFSSVLDWYYKQSTRLLHLALLFDDLHRGDGCAWLNEALSILRPVVSTGEHISIVLSGELPLEKEFRNDVSPLRNLVAGQTILGPLLPDEVKKLVRIAQDFEWDVETGSEQLAYELTGGHPYKLHYYLLEALTVYGRISCEALEASHNNLDARVFLSGILKEDTPTESPKTFHNVFTNPARRNNEMSESFVDFEVHLSPDGYISARSSQGEATERLNSGIIDSLPPILNSIDQRKTDASMLKAFGQMLYDLLLPGNIHTEFEKSEVAAHSRNSKVRLRMRLDHDSVASLPLEFIYRKSGGYFLAVNPSTVLSRYLNLPSPRNRVRRREGPLHLLVIIASPSDQTSLNPQEWEAIVTTTLAEPIREKNLTVKVVKHATRKGIRNALLDQKPDIIQFIGHGVYKNGRGYLALVNESGGKTWLVDDESFANIFFGSDDHLGLVSLATCESAKSDSPQGFLGIAPKIVQRGAPAVVAMQYSVFVRTAQVFLEDFYASIAARKPIDWAVQSARKAISLEFGLDNREFATPVLYMRAEDGIVF